jgi:hypothetical protein
MKPDWTNAYWRKSTHSDTGACVEVAVSNGTVGVRDTKDAGAGPILEFNDVEWAAFLAGVANGEFTMERLSHP